MPRWTPWRRAMPTQLLALAVDPLLVEYFSPTRLIRTQPNWWRRTPAFFEADLDQYLPQHLRMTIKHCRAVSELFRRGFLIRSWADYSLVVHPDGRIDRHGPELAAGHQHDAAQFPSMLVACPL